MRVRRRRYAAPDGCDWRNPRMPVFARWRGAGGVICDGYVDPTVLELVCQRGMTLPDFPSWRVDPSYHWAKKRNH